MQLPKVLTAIVTPFHNNGLVDYESMKKVIDHSIAHGTGVVIFGTTGECPTLKYDEKLSILSFVKSLLLPPNMVVIGVGGNDTHECKNFALEAKSYSFTNIMVTTPYYNKPSQEGLFQHFKEISDNFVTDLNEKIIIYNVPPRTNVNLLPDTLQRICKSCRGIYAIKEASGDLNQMIQIRSLCKDLVLYSGDDGLIVPVMSIGGYGVISVLSNILPNEVNNIVNLCDEKNYEDAFNLYLRFNKLIKLLFAEPNPSPIKSVLYTMDVINTPHVRLPLVEVQDPLAYSLSVEITQNLSDMQVN